MNDWYVFKAREVRWLNKHEFDKAIADLSQAVKRNPKDPHAYRNRGVGWARKADFDAAIADYDAAGIRLDPTDSDTHLNRGLA